MIEPNLISCSIVIGVFENLRIVTIAPVLDILIYGEPANKVFVQGLVSAGVNIVTTAVVGTLLCVAYSAAIPKKGSLKEED